MITSAVEPAAESAERTPTETAASVRVALRRELLIFVTVAPIIGLAFAILDGMGYLADTPLMNLLGLLAFAGTCLLASTWALWPFNTPLRIHIRTALMGAVAFMVIYATGWGPALVLGYAIVVSIEVGGWGSQAAWAYVWRFPIGVVAGQIAIATGAAPSLVPTPKAHALALLVAGITEFACILMAITAARRERANVSLRDNEQRFRSLIQSANDMIVVTDHSMTIRYASPAGFELTGFRPDDIVGKSMPFFVAPDSLDRVQDLMLEILTDPGVTRSTEVQGLHVDGGHRWLEATLTNLLEEPSVQGVVVNVRDVSTRKELQRRLTDLAFFDKLTGLPNRAAFMDRLEQAAARSRRHDTQIAVLFVDLDAFKTVNDSHGHAMGDALLTRVGERLRFCIRREDTVARLGGDEFTVLLEDLAFPHDTLVIANRIVEAHKAPFIVKRRELLVTASVGIAPFSAESPQSPEELIRQSDLAMYIAKSKGKARYELYEPGTSMDSARGVTKPLNS